MKNTTLLLITALLAPVSRAADDASVTSETVQAGQLGSNEGEIRKVDKEQGKLTIKHGPLADVDMPAMTMVFRVKDPAMLDQVAPGDNVRLQVAKIEGAFTVTALQKN